MGTAVVEEDPRHLRSQRESTAPPLMTSPPPPQAVDALSSLPQRVARWRVGERQASRSRSDLARQTLRHGERHPLSVDAPSSREQQSQQQLVIQPEDPAPVIISDTETLGRHKQELVLLHDGDVDPLGVLGGGSGVDLLGNVTIGTLTDASAEKQIVENQAKKLPAAPETVKQQWKAHKDRVLSKFENVTFKIKASMLEARDLENEISWTSKAGFQQESDESGTSSIHVIKKTRERLEELERKPRSGGSRRAGGDATVEMTQSEYVEKIRLMEKELVAAWDQNQKVAALRIAIKCVKLLGDTSSSPQLYPCVFVLVSDVLDTFGDLVFERIKVRASEDENGQPLPTPLSENFVTSDVNIQAKETCRNWFYKTACIRELLPRIYIEIALLRSYRFLCDGEYPQIISRLSNMIKGVGEPMVALYTRLYLALCGSELLPPSDKTAVLSSIFDYFFTFNFFQLRKLERWLQANDMTQAEYLGLHSPAVEWLMKCAASGCSFDAFETIVAHYREYSENSMVLKHICESFGPQFYASNPLAMLQLMHVAAPSQYSTCHLYSLLALQLSSSSTLTTTSEGKLEFLNEAWTSITSQEDIAQYMECAAAFMKLIVAHFSHREALILLKDVVRHLNAATPAELTPKAYNLMGALIENVVYGAEDHYEFFSKLIPSGEFLTLMGMFKRESSVGVAKKVLQAFVGAEMQKGKHSNTGSMRLHVVGPEAAVAHTLFVICCRVHDALDSLSTPTERADATKDICAFISRLGYAISSHGHDVGSQAEEEEEALLMLYIDCRGAFYKLEHVKTTLSKAVLSLAMHVHRRSTGGVIADKRTKNRRNFIKSCLAYAHITIPSISEPFRKLELMTLSAKVALVTNCLPQLDAFLKAAIIQITELDPSKFFSAGEIRGRGSIDGLEMLEFSSPLQEVDTYRLFSLTTHPENGGLLRTVGDLVSVLVYAPSLNDDDAFYFVNGLRKAVLERMAWDSLSSSAIPRVQVAATSSRVRILLFLMQLYGLWGQKRLPDRIAGVDSNDVLYGGHDDFVEKVNTYFSEVIEDVVREVEAMDSIGKGDQKASTPTSAHNFQTSSDTKGSVSSSASADVQIAQVDLMLDFINQVVPLLEQDESKMPEFGGGSSADLFASSGNTTGSSRRRRRGRCGAVLVRKCMAFIQEKVRALPTSAQENALLDSETRKRVAWASEYYESSRQYVSTYFQAQLVRGHLLSESSKQAIGALEDALSS